MNTATITKTMRNVDTGHYKDVMAKFRVSVKPFVHPWSHAVKSKEVPYTGFRYIKTRNPFGMLFESDVVPRSYGMMDF
jgi:hypothetical protein